MHFVTFVYIYNMHQDTKSAQLIAVCKRTLKWDIDSISARRKGGSKTAGVDPDSSNGVSVARAPVRFSSSDFKPTNPNLQKKGFYVIYETRGRVFHHISKHREVC